MTIGDLTGSRTHDFEDENLMSYPLDDETIWRPLQDLNLQHSP